MLVEGIVVGAIVRSVRLTLTTACTLRSLPCRLLVVTVVVVTLVVVAILVVTL
jgi:hypothetical protein